MVQILLPHAVTERLTVALFAAVSRGFAEAHEVPPPIEQFPQLLPPLR